MRSGAAVVVGATLALTVLGPASARTHAPARYGGVLVVGLNSDPDILDPTLSNGSANPPIYRAICDPLYDYDSKAQIVPLLAAALPVLSKDKLTYTIPLRQGANFNDGTPFNAQAVVTTLLRNMMLPGSQRASDLESVDTVTTSGPYTVVIHLKTPYTPLTANLSQATGLIMSPTQLAKLGTNFGTDPVCVGPFMFDHRVVGDNITVIKSPYYYNKEAVHLDKIVFKPMPEAPAAAAALKAGDVQVLDGVSTTELPGIQQNPSLRVLKQNSLGWNDIIINIGNKNGVRNLPYANVGTPLASSAKLRQAFEEAIDRNALNKVVFDGLVQPGCTPIAPASPWYDASIRCTPYDPANAKKLVAASGFSNPTVHLLTSGTDNLRLAQFVQAQEAAVGINVVIDSTDLATVTSRATAGSYDTYMGGPGGGVDPDINIYIWLATSGSRNRSGYSNPRLDLILNNGRKAMTTQARRTLYHAAEQIILNDRPMITLYHAIKFVGVNTQVAGVHFCGPYTVLCLAFAQYR